MKNVPFLEKNIQSFECKYLDQELGTAVKKLK